MTYSIYTTKNIITAKSSEPNVIKLFERSKKISDEFLLFDISNAAIPIRDINYLIIKEF